MEREQEPIFQERQRFTQKWILVLVSILALGTWGMALVRFAFHRPKESGALEDTLMILTWIVVGVGIPYLFLAMQLTTEVRGDGLYLRYAPFHRCPRVFHWEELSRFQARRYRPLREYGGWGIRWGPAGRAYNVRGDRGVQLVFKDGRRLMVGSQRAEELEEAMRRASGEPGPANDTA